MTADLVRADSGFATTITTSCAQSNLKFHEEQPVHPLEDEVVCQTDEYVLRQWEFENDAARIAFIRQDVGRLACEYFPDALDDRMFLMARMLAVLYLVAESLTELDLEDSEEYLEALGSAMSGHWLPDEDVPALSMLCGVADELRALDYLAADDIIELALSHLRANLVCRGRATHRYEERSIPRSLRLGPSFAGALASFAAGKAFEDI